MYEYKCKILKVIDGDTVDVDIDLGFGIHMHDERIRIKGIDTPESRTRDLVEKQFGLAAKHKVMTLLPIGSEQVIRTYKDKNGKDGKGKFGRILGDFVKPNGDTLTEIMIRENFAVRYEGQAKELVEESHLKNREALLERGIVVLE